MANNKFFTKVVSLTLLSSGVVWLNSRRKFLYSPYILVCSVKNYFLQLNYLATFSIYKLVCIKIFFLRNGNEKNEIVWEFQVIFATGMPQVWGLKILLRKEVVGKK